MEPETEPEVPQVPPPVPRGKFWTGIITSILIPPGITLLLLETQHLHDWPLVMFAIIFCSMPYVDTLKMRYRGRSLFLLAAAYAVGEIVVCLMIGFVLPYLFPHGI